MTRRATTAGAGQLDLLAWAPPAAVARFADERVRAASLAGLVCRAVSEALKDCGMPREQVAARMSAYLGEDVSKHMLDAYASEARDQHNISVVRLVALLHATADRRLLEVFAELFDWAVIERKFLRLIDIAALQEREDELRRAREALRREAKAAGVL